MTLPRSRLLVPLLILLALACYMQYITGNAGDKDWLLYVATMTLKGQKLYEDIVEPNPPLIIWLYTIPAYIALKTGMQDFHVLMLLTFALIALSVTFCLHLVREHGAFPDSPVRRRQLMLLLLFVLIFRTDPSYFGDRDHLFLVMTMPYVFRWLPGNTASNYSWKLRAGVGFLAAVGFCIKPHCMMVFAGIQLIVILMRGSFAILVSIENALIYAGIACYLLCIKYFAPEYLHTVLPMTLLTYGAFNRRTDGLLYGGVALFTFLVSFSEFRPRHNTPFRRDIYYLIALCFFLLCYASANNGWGYSYNPLMTYVLIAAGWLLWEFSYLASCDPSVKQFRFGRRAVLLAISGHAVFGVLLICVGIWGMLTFRCEDYAGCLMSQAILKEIKPENEAPRPFSTMSVVVGSWSGLSKYSGAPWVTRFNCLWMMHKFFISPPMFTYVNGDIPRYTSNAIAADLEKQKPKVVFVDVNVQTARGHDPVDMPAYFSAYPSFARAWKHYRYGHRIDYCTSPHQEQNANATKRVASGCAFDIYYRTPENTVK